MRRLFWMAVGAALGIWAYQRGGAALERARERGVVGNVAAATATATRVATTTGRAVAAAGEQGARVAARFAPENQASGLPAGTAAPAAATPPAAATVPPQAGAPAANGDEGSR